MKNIPTFEQFVNEAVQSPEGAVTLFEHGLIKVFGNTISYGRSFGKNKEYYNYKDGYVQVTNDYRIAVTDWLPKKSVEILLKAGLTDINNMLTARIDTFLPIGDRTSPETSAQIYVTGDRYLHGSVQLNIQKDVQSQLKSAVKGFQKSVPLNTPDILDRLFMNWQKTSYDAKTLSSKDIGYGSAASTHILKSFNSAYSIKDIDKALGMSKVALEAYLSSNWRFKKDQLAFDWKSGVMIVNGTYTEVWD